METVIALDHWIPTGKGAVFARSWAAEDASGPPVILLHNSLGCVALWRDFPAHLAASTHRQVIAYDRLGFGRSDPQTEPLPMRFIGDGAQEVFKSVRTHFNVDRFVVLGHSVGGGMAIGCAATYADACAGVITLAAQVCVDEQVLSGIRIAKAQFAQPGQIDRLKKHHGEKAQWVLDVWTETWLSPEFAGWSLDAQLPQVRCPALLVHGDRDEYCSIRHPERIAGRMTGTASIHFLHDCGHAPHSEHPAAACEAIANFLASGRVT